MEKRNETRIKPPRIRSLEFGGVLEGLFVSDLLPSPLPLRVRACVCVCMHSGITVVECAELLSMSAAWVGAELGRLHSMGLVYREMLGGCFLYRATDRTRGYVSLAIADRLAAASALLDSIADNPRSRRDLVNGLRDSLG